MASRILEPLVSRQLLSHKSPFCNSLDGTLVCDHSDESYQAAFQVLYLAYTSVDKTLLRLASMSPFKWKLDIFQLKWLVCLFKVFYNTKSNESWIFWEVFLCRQFTDTCNLWPFRGHVWPVFVFSNLHNIQCLFPSQTISIWDSLHIQHTWVSSNVHTIL